MVAEAKFVIVINAALGDKVAKSDNENRSNTMLKLLVIEDHALVREGLVQTLHQLDAKVSVMEAADCESGCTILAQADDFDLVLLDLALPGIDGLTCLNLLRQRHPALPVVIVSAYDDTHTVTRALKAGAAGFVPKAYSGDRLLDALRQVLEGTIFVPEQTLPANHGLGLAVPPTGKDVSASEVGLTGRQTDVLALMVKGRSNRDIAELLGLSEGTVKIHITAIFKALGVASRTQALVAVARLGLKL
jgi:DNA-binding NarL/FixJ family response regulator